MKCLLCFAAGVIAGVVGVYLIIYIGVFSKTILPTFESEE